MILNIGFEIRCDSYGRIYFVDHNTRSTTYEDPRKSQNSAKVGAKPASKDFEKIPSEDITIVSKIGSGNFGDVFKGKFFNIFFVISIEIFYFPPRNVVFQCSCIENVEIIFPRNFGW
jgi:hypothetical protein